MLSSTPLLGWYGLVQQLRLLLLLSTSAVVGAIDVLKLSYTAVMVGDMVEAMVGPIEEDTSDSYETMGGRHHAR